MTTASPKYRVLVYAFGASFGIGSLVVEIENAKAVGVGQYLNDVPEAFFTVNQDDPKAEYLRNYKGKCHVRIYRDSDLLFAGWGAMELDSDDRQTIVYCYGYLAGLYWSLTDWNKTWRKQTLKTIIDESWVRAKTTITSSTLGFVTTGTTEELVTTSGGATSITLPEYIQFYKRILFIYKEFAALAISDTTNTPVFEIAHSTTPTFNFWKNRGTDKDSVKWEYGGGLVAGYKVYEEPVWRRNSVRAVGSAPQNELLRYDYTVAGDYTAYGQRQEPLYLRYVRDQTELQRVVPFRTAKALRDNPEIVLRFFPNSIIPPGATGALFALSDRVKVKIDHGTVNIDGRYLVTGFESLWLRGVEYFKAYVEERYG